MAQIQPAELDFWFELQQAGDVDTPVNQYIDLAQCASIVNRRFYRQGYQWAVAQCEVVSDVSTTTEIRRLPETWVCANAWVKAFSTWRASRDQVLEDQPSLVSKYSDFKVFYDPTQQAAGMAANELPNPFASPPVFGLDESYEWAAAEIEIPNDPAPGATQGYNLHMLGDSNASSKGIIHGYAMSRARPTQEEPNVPQPGGWMLEAFDVGDNLDEIRQDIADENDEPPYLVGTQVGVNVNREFYPGGAIIGGEQTEAFMITRAGTALAQSFAPAFTAPLGLLKVQSQFKAEPDKYSLRITLMPGDYKGCMARPMQGMN